MGGWVGPKSSLDAVGKLKISSHSGNWTLDDESVIWILKK
jgi:hypothetical protein